MSQWRKLQTDTNLEVAASHIMQTRYPPRFLEDPDNYAPQLLHVTRSVVKAKWKTVVLVREHTGFKFFLQLLEERRSDDAETFGIARA